MTRDQLRKFLNDRGFPIGESSFDKICMPSRNEGPEVEAYWGRRPLYRPDRGLEWASSQKRENTKPEKLWPLEVWDLPPSGHRLVVSKQ
jgi:hypothetical protein